MLVLEIALGILLAPVLGMLAVCAFVVIMRMLAEPLVWIILCFLAATFMILILFAFPFIVPGSRLGAGDVVPYVGVMLFGVIGACTYHYIAANFVGWCQHIGRRFVGWRRH
jgi:hypothetical protein